MFLRSTLRKKDGKKLRTWSVVETRRVAAARWCSARFCIWARSTKARPPRGANRLPCWKTVPPNRARPRCSPTTGPKAWQTTARSSACTWPNGPCTILTNGVPAGLACICRKNYTSTVSGPTACQPAARARAGITSCWWTLYLLLAPGSEWRLHRQWLNRPAVPDPLGAVAALGATRALYACHDRLLALKIARFSQLGDRWRDLFNPTSTSCSTTLPAPIPRPIPPSRKATRAASAAAATSAPTACRSSSRWSSRRTDCHWRTRCWTATSPTRRP